MPKQATKRHQVEVEIVKEDGDGNVDLEHLKQLIAKPTRKPALIAITYIPTSSGQLSLRLLANPTAIAGTCFEQCLAVIFALYMPHKIQTLFLQ